MGGGVEDKSRKRGGRRPHTVAGRGTVGSVSRGRSETLAHGASGRTVSMGKGGNQGEGSTECKTPMPTFRWEEIQKHNLRTDRWLVIDRKVYNVSKWSQRHPGGHRVIGHYSGEDATVRVWGCQPPLSAAGRCQEPGVPGRQTDLQL